MKNIILSLVCGIIASIITVILHKYNVDVILAFVIALTISITLCFIITEISFKIEDHK